MKYCVAISDRALERIAILLPNLRTLCLASCKRISDEGIEYLGSQRRRRLPHLQTLDLSHCERITNGGACSLLEEHDRGDDNDNDNDNDDDDDRTAKSSPQLQSLSLSACTQISRLSALRCSSSCSSIVSLVLSDCIDITDECLCDLTLLSQLRQLRLDGCTRITDAGFCHLIPFLLCLCDLDLTGCLLLTDASVVAISLSCLVTLQPRDRCECRCLE
ncbi:receptor-type protein kinase, putative [Bodo saltans]|uniref:Receptor-type protein kinase, putative n=1 Tax=Bodo saltans TaxID=75058 RepID=A0A0S4IIR1_BODSA|nr:receptor-type protein kinase, putative [Bodo saltans]|eukprot:CUE72890.1 receptor-type protein kinase, putative [Bodo saltans]